MTMNKGSAAALIMSAAALIITGIAVVMQITFNGISSPAIIEKKNLSATVENRYGFSMFARTGDTLYVSGITGHTNGRFSDKPEDQYQQAYENISQALAIYGVSMNDVVSERVYYTEKLKNMDAAVRRKIRGVIYNDSFPASTWVQVVALDSPGAMVEIEVVVALTAAEAD